MRFRLRTLLILLAIGPPMLAEAWPWYLDYRSRKETKATAEQYILRLRSDPSPRPVRLGQAKLVFDADGNFRFEPIGPQP